MGSETDSYPIHILRIKLWEWEAVREKASMDIAKGGPDEYNTGTYNTASANITELSNAINILLSPPQIS